MTSSHLSGSPLLDAPEGTAWQNAVEGALQRMSLLPKAHIVMGRTWNTGLSQIPGRQMRKRERD